MRLTVYFDGQFWVGFFEEQTRAGLGVLRHLFGAEPSDQEIFELVLDMPAMSGPRSPAGESSEQGPSAPPEKINPKRLAREAAKALARHGVSTKSQETLRRQMEARKQERQQASRQEREAERERRRGIAREKARKKHLGH